MLLTALKAFVIVAAIFVGALNSYSQTAADNTPMARPGSFDKENSHPRSIRDTLEKMRIEREKKEYDKMLERGEQAVLIASELEAALETNGRLTEKEMAKLASVEKLAKQIRSDLGGGDDEEKERPVDDTRLSVSEAVRSLKESAQDLFDELKKTSRFTISAAAIYSSNTVMRLARFMRIAN